MICVVEIVHEWDHDDPVITTFRRFLILEFKVERTRVDEIPVMQVRTLIACFAHIHDKRPVFKHLSHLLV